MRDQSIHGWALVLGTVAMLGTGTMHPTGPQLLASAEAFERSGTLNIVAHGLALVGVWLGFFGAVGLSKRLGLWRPDVMAALVAYALVAVMIALAAVVDGIVATRLAGAYVTTADEHERELLRAFMHYSVNIASSISRVYVSGAALAMLLWSWAAWRTGFSRVLAGLGLAIAVVALVAQLAGHLRMNVHDVLLLAAGQGLWFAVAGIALVRERPRS
ncbi:MAG: hypothetical protein J0L88_03895 [Xanthomonadales bacterium]|nr:hypothetical protein [Xanthomonadales bacterium]